MENSISIDFKRLLCDWFELRSNRSYLTDDDVKVMRSALCRQGLDYCNGEIVRVVDDRLSISVKKGNWYRCISDGLVGFELGKLYYCVSDGFLRIRDENGSDISYSVVDGFEYVDYAPKFSVGDWVTDGKRVYNILYVGTDDGKYSVSCGDAISNDVSIEFIDECFRRWHIDDAKDGDILYIDNVVGTHTNRWIIKFSSLNNGMIYRYFSIYYTNIFSVDDSYELNHDKSVRIWGHLSEVGTVRPVVNCELNFMNNCLLSSDYVWNDEEKVLEKIMKPKFNDYDFVIGVDNRICKIIDIENGYYYYRDEEDGETHYLEVEKMDAVYHLWDISDARDGDVLQLGGETVIYCSTYDEKCIRCHCSYNVDDGFRVFINKEDQLFGISRARPATFEERKKLYGKMYRSGYVWDGEEKCLRDINRSFDEILRDGSLEECKIKRVRNELLDAVANYLRSHTGLYEDDIDNIWKGLCSGGKR